MRIMVMGTAQGFGGLETHFQCLLRFLIEEKHEVYALAVADPEIAFDAPAGLRGVTHVPHGALSLGGKYRKYVALRGCEAEIRRFRPELFVASATGRGYAQMARCARKVGAFTIWQEVSLPAPFDRLHTTMCNSVDVVALQTLGMVAPFRRAIPGAERVGTLPCFFNSAICDGEAKPPGKDEPLRLASFGRLAKNKGLAPFLQIFHSLAKQTSLKLDIHGDGEERAALRKTIVDLGLENSVRLRGRYPSGPEFGSLLSAYHALVLPSIDCEGLPLVLLEAMSCGLPFLATSIGGIADAAIDNPDVVVVPPDRESLKAGLHQLVDKLKSGTISNSRLKAHAARNFSNASFAAAWRTVLANPISAFL